MKTYIWDLPLRLFHAALAIVFLLAWLSVEILDDLELHFLCGYTLLGLMVFRLIWGVVGTEHARFKGFVVGPTAIVRFLSGHVESYRGGHNPLGALSVIFLITAITAQAISGLFTDDEYYFFGPLNRFVSADLADLMSAFHHLNADIILIAVGLHLLAIAYYELIKRERLILPMITGYKQDNAKQFTPIPHSKLALALIIAVVVATGVIAIASLEVSY